MGGSSRGQGVSCPRALALLPQMPRGHQLNDNGCMGALTIPNLIDSMVTQ